MISGSNSLIGRVLLGLPDLAGDRTFTRFGNGAMQLAGPNVFGPPRDRDAAIEVLRQVVEIGITSVAHLTRERQRVRSRAASRHAR